MKGGQAAAGRARREGRQWPGGREGRAGSGGAGAVESGIATAAAVELGQMRLLGEGVERSEAGAIELFEQAAWFGVRVRG